MAGHPRNVKTPEKMWELFCEYAEQVKANPRKKMVFVGKDGSKDFEELERPLTLEGFENWCYDRVGCVGQYFDNKDGLYEEYVAIITRIRKEIRNDQIEGGMVGQYQHTITARLNGLAEKTDNTHNIEVVPFKGIDLNVKQE